MSQPVSRTVSIFINQDQAERSLKNLEKAQDRLTKAIDKGKTAGKDMTKEMSELDKVNGKIENLRGILDGKLAPAFNQVKKRVKELQTELMGMSDGAPGYAAKFREFEKVSQQFEGMRKKIQGVKKSMDDAGSGGFLNNLKQGFVQGLGIGGAVEMVGAAIGKVRELFSESSRLAAEMEGVEVAFSRINQPGLLDNLREATRGTVSDLELMKSAVQFQNFGLPVEKLATALNFARIRAKETGQEVDFLVNSIVVGVGRQSPLILDNLGINAKRVADEFKRTGNFADAAFKIIQEEAQKATNDLSTFNEMQDRLNAKIENQQAALGRLLNDVKGFYGSILQDIGSFEVKNARLQYNHLREYIAMQEKKKRAAVEQAQVNVQQNAVFLQNFKQFTDQYASADFANRSKIKQQAKEMYGTLIKNAEQYVASGKKLDDSYFMGLKQAYQQATNYFQKTPINLKSVDASQLGGLSKEQLESLQEQINLARTSLNSTDKTQIDYYNKLSEAISKYLNVINGVKDTKGESEAKRQREEFKQLQEELKALNAEVAAMVTDAAKNGKANDEQEIVRVSQKYAKLLERAKGHAAEIAQLNELQAKEIDVLVKKQFDDRSSNEYNASLQNLENFYNQQRQVAGQQYADSAIDKQRYTAIMVQLDLDEAEDRATVSKDYAATVVKAANDVEENKTKAVKKGIAQRESIERQAEEERIYKAEREVISAPIGTKKRLDAEISLINERYAQEFEAAQGNAEKMKLLEVQKGQEIQKIQKQYLMGKIADVLEVAQAVANAWATVSDQMAQQGRAELDRDRAENDKKKDNLRRQLDAKQISEETYRRKVEALDKEFANKERAQKKKEFNNNKALSLMQAAINGALAITDIWSKHAANPVLAGILTGIVGAANTIQIGMIAKQKFPEYAKGKRAGGVPQGASHADGGIALVDSASGMKVGEMEGGEPILSKDTYRNNRPLVDALLDASLNRNGASIAPDWAMRMPSSVNTSRILQSVTSSILEKGGFFSQSTSSGAATATTSTQMPVPVFSAEDLNAFKEFTKVLKNPIKAEMSWSHFRTQQDVMNELQELSSLKQ